MRKSIFISLISLSLTVFAQDKLQNNDSIIYWNETKNLVWDDFKMETKDSIKLKKFHAIASTSLSVSYSVEGKNIKFIVYSKFFRFDSCVFFKTNYLLKHEQLHFDIVELFARILRKKFISLRDNNAKFEQYVSTYNEMKEDLRKYQVLYDIETSHSKNKVKQKEWEDLVRFKLKDLEPYKFDSYLDSIR